MRMTLLILLSLVLHTLALQAQHHTIEKKVTLRTVKPMNIDYEKTEALSLLNAIRAEMGMNALLQHDLLTLAAQGHADYLVANHVSSHNEKEGMKKFVGKRPVDRTLDANYASMHVSENLTTHTYTAQSSMDGLFAAIYHRFGFLSPGIDTIGVGVTQEKSHTANSAFVYVMGNSALEALCYDKSFSGHGKYYYKLCKNQKHRISESSFLAAKNHNKKHNPEIIYYPYDGQRDVPPVFYEETPDPLPKHEVSGFPVSIEFNDYFYEKVTLLSFKLYQGESEMTDVLFMDKNNDPNKRFTDKQFALFPLKRLKYNTQYKVEVSYRYQGETLTHSWAFHTYKPTEPLHVIHNKVSTLYLSKGKSHILYFPPHDAHDLLKSMQFPSAVDVVFMDHNTLKLTLKEKTPHTFTLKSKDRSIHVIMQ